MTTPVPIHSPDIVQKPPARLHTNPRNARTHSRAQIKQIADSIRAFGFTNPILVDEDDRVLAGHGRLAAAKRLGLEAVPTLRLSGLSDVQKRAYVLADNKLAEKAGWDSALLAAELGDLATLMPTLEFDWPIEITGFSAGEIEGLGHDAAEERAEPEDELPPQGGDTPVSRPGDLWQLGRHVVACGDARSPADLDRLMAGTQADMVFTDPPYNVPIAGHVTRRKDIGGHREFAFASGEMSCEAFRAFLAACLGNAVRVSRPGAIHDVCMDWRHIADLIAVGEGLYDALLNLCVWNKGSAGQGSFYRSQHELVAIFRVGCAAHRNTVALGQFGRNRSNVWTYPGVAGFGRERAAALAMHPTVKPVALVADALRDCTLRGDRVLDPFLGSGSTVIAAEKVGRVTYGLEYDPRYVDTIIRRWQAYTGRDAILTGTETTFGEVEAARAVPDDIIGEDDGSGSRAVTGGRHGEG